MEKLHPSRSNWWEVLFGGIVLLVIGADQLTKWWIKSNLQLGESLFDIGFFRIIRIYNTGAAFGIFKDYSQVFIIAAIIGIIVVLGLVIFLRGRWYFIDDLLVRSSIGLMLGGIAGNLIDRLVDNGRVTDFIDFKVWPAFNVADASSVVGTIILAYCILFKLRPSGLKG
jgi:signal peptidase II